MKRRITFLIVCAALILPGCAQYGYIEHIESGRDSTHLVLGINQGGDVLFREMKIQTHVTYGCEVKFRGKRILSADCPKFQ